MDKAPDAFRTISEVADELDIPQHVLRFWETRFTQIRPMKRSGGRRFYRPDDVDLLRGIRRLLYTDGYTIRGVQRILKEQGVKAVQAMEPGAYAPLPQQVVEAEQSPAAPIRKTRAALEVREEIADIDEPDFDARDDNDGEGPSIVVTPPLPKPFTTPLPSLELRPNSIQTVGMVPRAGLSQETVLPRAPQPAAISTAPPTTHLPDITFDTLVPTPRRMPSVDARAAPPSFDTKRLIPVLNELMAVRRLLDAAMLNGEPGV